MGNNIERDSGNKPEALHLAVVNVIIVSTRQLRYNNKK